MNTQSKAVNLLKRVKTADGWYFFPVARTGNGYIRPDLVIINERVERHSEGAYYLEWWEGAKRIRLSVGKDAADASARRLQKEAELNAVNHGVVVTPQDGNGNGQKSLSLTVQEFLAETKLTKH